MRWRAVIDQRESLIFDAVALWLVEDIGNGGVRVHGATEDRVLASGEHAPDDLQPIRIPGAAAHAVLAALSRHLGAVEHPEQLRRDFEHERGRVDRLLTAITDLATRRSEG